MPQNIRQVFPRVRFHVSLNVKSTSPTARAGSNKLRRSTTAKAGQRQQKNHRDRASRNLGAATCSDGRQQKRHRQNDHQRGKENDQSDRKPHPHITPQVFGGDIAAAKSRMFAQNNASMPRDCDTDAGKCENQDSNGYKHYRFNRFRVASAGAFRVSCPPLTSDDQRKLQPAHDARQRCNHRQPQPGYAQHIRKIMEIGRI